MKKFIYLSIIIATLSLSSFGTQNENVHLKGVKASQTSSKEIKSKTYVTFNPSVAQEIDSVKPPQE